MLSVNFRTAQSLTATLCGCPSKHFYSATAAAVVQSRLDEPCSVYYFALFRVVSCSFVPLSRTSSRRRHCFSYLLTQYRHLHFIDHSPEEPGLLDFPAVFFSPPAPAKESLWDKWHGCPSCLPAIGSKQGACPGGIKRFIPQIVVHCTSKGQIGKCDNRLNIYSEIYDILCTPLVKALKESRSTGAKQQESPASSFLHQPPTGTEYRGKGR